MLLVGFHLDQSSSIGAETITLEAENGILDGTSVSSKVPGYSASGYVTGFRATNSLVRWEFKASAGPYRLIVRFRSPYGQKNFVGVVNGSSISGIFPRRNSFDIQDIGSFEMAAGTNTIQLGGGTGFYDIDSVELFPYPRPLPVPAKLSDPQATARTRELMQRLANDYGKLTWSGQQETGDLPYIQKIAQRSPLIIAGDFLEYCPTRVERNKRPASYTEDLIALARSNHVLAFSWHWNAPTNLLDSKDQPWWKAFYTSATTFNVAAALDDTNSAEYGLILRDIDVIAGELKKTAAADIPILWRPLHEAEFGGFWWGAKGPEAFKRLWRLLYSRLSGHHGLHNLIWVLSNEREDWYPGDDVVDIVGVDGYPKNQSDTLRPRWEALKSRLDGKKLIALTEFGGVPDIEKMHGYGVWWSWFLSWVGDQYGPPSSPTNVVVRTYQSPEVATFSRAP
ncbi:MAG TPA: glycosyl hydrolase [Verrucomicrobiae bacterium]|nr:glycosyl hydrolase [Verrucomicrobiae bacterium]